MVHSQLGEVRLAVKHIAQVVEVEDTRLMRLAQIVEGLGEAQGAHSVLVEIMTLRRRLWQPGVDVI